MHDFGTLRPKSWDIKGANFFIDYEPTHEREKKVLASSSEREGGKALRA